MTTRHIPGLCAMAALIALGGCFSAGTDQPSGPASAPEAAAEGAPDKARLESSALPAPGFSESISMQRQARASADMAGLRFASEPVDRENYAAFADNPLRLVREHPVSTFSIDVDTGAYANVRRILNAGHLPPEAAVRVEEMINYFSYDYPSPAGREVPFSVIRELAVTPWNPDTRLLHLGIKGLEIPAAERPPANLVFLIDVSGSMRSPDKLPLLKEALGMLAGNLGDRDRVAMVVYAGASGVVLEPTAGSDRPRILDALDRLTAGGSTNGGSGIRLAYQLARTAKIDGGINRIVLATDGDFNVGTVSLESLKDLIGRNRNDGISLTTLGFGTGNYNDALMEQLADVGNGNYAYIDGLREARKVLVDELGATLQTIAKDVKIQVEFNPARVAEYRLIGYENRSLRREDFTNDRIDAGEIGAGHTVTALYEITLADSPGQRIEPLRYGRTAMTPPSEAGDEYAYVRLRHKLPGESRSRESGFPVTESDLADPAQSSPGFRFSAAVAAFGQKLRGGDYLGTFSYPQIRRLANSALGEDRLGYRTEFVALVDRAAALEDGTTHLIGAGDAQRQ